MGMAARVGDGGEGWGWQRDEGRMTEGLAADRRGEELGMGRQG